MLRNSEHIKFFLWFVVLSTVFLGGCAKPPTQEIENANRSVAEAKQKEADLYVQDVFSKAEEALNKATGYVAEKKYKEAKASAEEALSMAQQSISMIEPNRAKMKADAEQLMIDLQNSLGELKSSLAKTIKKKATIDREKIQNAVGMWEIDMVSVREQMQAGKIRQAHDLLLDIQEQMRINKEEMAATMPTTEERK